jgi:hypothetical protein
VAGARSATRPKKEYFMARKLAMVADSPTDYERLGLSPTTIAVWEDGARTDDSTGTYEGGTWTRT